jgi:hypothetical protein
MRMDYYPGDDGRGDYFFSLKSWIEIQSHLVTPEAIMRMLANKYRLKYLSNIRGEWPARRLKVRSLFKSHEITLMLNPDYLQDKKIYYELSRTCILNIINVYSKLVESEVITKYSINEIKSESLILRDIENTIMKIRGKA